MVHILEEKCEIQWINSIPQHLMDRPVAGHISLGIHSTGKRNLSLLISRPSPTYERRTSAKSQTRYRGESTPSTDSSRISVLQHLQIRFKCLTLHNRIVPKKTRCYPRSIYALTKATARRMRYIASGHSRGLFGHDDASVQQR